MDPSPAASEQAGSLSSAGHSGHPSIIVKGIDELDGLFFHDEAASGALADHTQASAPSPDMEPSQAGAKHQDLAETTGKELVVTSSTPEGSGLHALASQSPGKQQGASLTELSQISPTAGANYDQGTGSHGITSLSGSSKCDRPEQLDGHFEPLLRISGAHAKTAECAADPSSLMPPDHSSYDLDTSTPEVHSPGPQPALKNNSVGGAATIATSSPHPAGSSAESVQPDDHQEDSNEGCAHDEASASKPMDTRCTEQPGFVQSPVEGASAGGGLRHETAREAGGGAGDSKRSFVLLDWALDQQQVRGMFLAGHLMPAFCMSMEEAP